jgi:hypothetical protein
MKKIIFFLSFIFFILPHSQGQTFASATQPIKQNINGYSSTNFINYTSHPRISPLTITGIAIAGVGCVVSLTGFVLYAGTTGDKYVDNSSNDALMIGGVVMVLTGGVLLIIGSEHDHNKKMGIVSPKNNEIGLAYNF